MRQLLADLPPLPLLLWGTPPGLEMILRQEGIAHATISEPHPLAFNAGRFVLYDRQRVASRVVSEMLGPGHVAIDVDALRRTSGVDPFEALIDTRAARHSWTIGGYDVSERVARQPKADLRRLVLKRLREAVTRAGGVWARLAAYPHPFRSAFGFRADLDEPYPDDYARFARARRPIEDCTTHFVSTRAYGNDRGVLSDLARCDTQSHGHHHVVYRGDDANRRNIERAHGILAAAGFEPVGFAGPEGRWTPGLYRALEDRGYLYSSDFQLGYDDFPFFPWVGDRFSRVLQVPIHPICEGIFLDAGAEDGQVIADHLAHAVRAKLAAGEPAFVYGHPERRLARFPDVIERLSRAIRASDLTWRVTLTEFARWWTWRSQRRWSLSPKSDGRLEVQFEDWEPGYPLALEIVRGDHMASIPLRGPITPLRPAELAYVRRATRADLPEPTIAPPHVGIKSLVRAALDWETVTPWEELPEDTLRARLKKGLRRWRAGAARGVGS